MSLISEQIKRLRKKADIFQKRGYAVDGIVKELREAANTIEMLSEKVRADVPETNVEKWIPRGERLPENDNYIMVSFENFSLPDIGRYKVDKEGGAFYPGDDDKSYLSYGLFVNAWMSLPEPYKEG